MTSVVEKLVKLLDVTPIEKNVFLGNSQDLGFKSLFGGQVLGQALVAASRTVEPERDIHSLQSYFLRPGTSKDPLYYEVDLIRSGRRFSTRRVVAKQNGLAIFSMSASFQTPEPGFEHQVEKPRVPGPDGIQSELEYARMVQDKLPVSMRERLTAERAIEIRVLDPVDVFKPQPRPGLKYSWIRAIEKLPDDPIIHKALLVYASDFGLTTTSLLPHGVSFFQPEIQVASLDHSMWFHRDFRMDEWLLYVKESTSASKARGLNRGQFFSQNGDLVASVAQEGLIRKVKSKEPLQAPSS